MTEEDPIVTTKQRVRFDDRNHAYQLAIELIKQAKKEICFFGASLDPVLFDQPEMVQMISDFARRHPQTRVRFLVQSTAKNVAEGHRLISLAQRLSSSLFIHISSDEDSANQQMFLLSDVTGYLYCNSNTRYQGYACLDSPAEAKNLYREFERLWTASHPDIHTRRLHL